MSSELLVGNSSNQTALMSSTVSNGAAAGGGGGGGGGGGELGASLLGVGNGGTSGDATSLPKFAARPMVEVVAPSTMAEGYEFHVQISGQTFPVTVPAGGVQEGQRFQVPMPESSGQALNQAVSFPKITVPVGHWRDGLCSCCSPGICHSVMWMGFLCLPVLMGQIMTRLHLNWLGRPPSTLTSETSEGTKSWKFTWSITVGISLAFFTLERLCWFSITGHLIFDPEYTMDMAAVDNPVPYYTRFLLIFLHSFYGFWTVYHTRRFLRAKYAIPPECGTAAASAGDASSSFSADVAVSCFCSCCAATQMARHTSDYKVYPAVCCNDSGLPSGVPDIV